ncbi:MAG: 4Fe-4S ferredoxin [Armatimonadetes bacterium CG_4_10_14_3_um_filter_66_18]|nr:MAG: 4Fe-4S ferredoxin [Armatimonadetes bacterium CG06_land_8_20_14_3_00_66_21]PIW12941.1 MAG: 4Fe-4S ferredoxin [Armatimonadetes bacterium CG17_big_fil_post_rev_8_21_14_2_50_66_6]PIX47020.1 MAG: 4Fe-4S ferredoxin [Armatimonadetes bacterium CG_4_8_14_3_um_filter_66_20]PIY50495.1 MAG: 4Fe-4S ferredoxin [Armatimonadetes bacterium CG_4_10_14_3_um_filter_66_18]PJB62524.1 MAG: 4Fe-4S ferredoxin [Armatimonadetes bacterium CG_4_9_14_3_um_filter_66_14]
MRSPTSILAIVPSKSEKMIARCGGIVPLRPACLVDPGRVSLPGGWCAILICKAVALQGGCRSGSSGAAMCEFCTRHGDGKKWYLRADAYSHELAQDLQRRKYTEHFVRDFGAIMRTNLAALEQFARAPRPLRHLLRSLASNYMKSRHFGQVVPLQDFAAIMPFVNSVVRLPCLCRDFLRKEAGGYCLAFSLGPNDGFMAEVVDESFWQGIDAAGLQRVEIAEALRLLAQFDDEGLVHTLWTAGPPLTVCVCNCRLGDCLAMRVTLDLKTRAFFRGEYAAELRDELCTGCGLCVERCQFGAVHTVDDTGRVCLDPERCYGCGLCAAACPTNAVRLRDRNEVPAAASLW